MSDLPQGLTREEAWAYLDAHYPSVILQDDPEWAEEMVDALMEPAPRGGENNGDTS